MCVFYSSWFRVLRGFRPQPLLPPPPFPNPRCERGPTESLTAVQNGTSHDALILSSCMRFTTFWAKSCSNGDSPNPCLDAKNPFAKEPCIGDCNRLYIRSALTVFILLSRARMANHMEQHRIKHTTRWVCSS